MKQSSDATFYFDQSIGFMLFFIKKSLVFEKGFDPKNPLYAENGIGWCDSNIKCLGFGIKTFLLRAKLPHKINTIGFSLKFNTFIT